MVGGPFFEAKKWGKLFLHNCSWLFDGVARVSPGEGVQGTGRWGITGAYRVFPAR